MERKYGIAVDDKGWLEWNEAAQTWVFSGSSQYATRFSHRTDAVLIVRNFKDMSWVKQSELVVREIQ